ncbi:MAG TPA: metalloregulator ArsR/SmtB family transcription factor [Caulobacteraceae bacterium]
MKQTLHPRSGGGGPPAQAGGGGGARRPRLASGSPLDRTLAALADPHRRRCIELLRERPRQTGELARDLGLAAPAMSRHLRTLRQCGLVEQTHPAFDARVRIYALRSAGLARLARWLEETEAMWAHQLVPAAR